MPGAQGGSRRPGRGAAGRGGGAPAAVTGARGGGGSRSVKDRLGTDASPDRPPEDLGPGRRGWRAGAAAPTGAAQASRRTVHPEARAGGRSGPGGPSARAGPAPRPPLALPGAGGARRWGDAGNHGPARPPAHPRGAGPLPGGGGVHCVHAGHAWRGAHRPLTGGGARQG